MEKRLYGIRGAVCVENTKESIISFVSELGASVFTRNKLHADDIVSIQFTVTEDIDAFNPAAALRHGNCGIDVSHCALFTAQEPPIVNSLSHVIRVLVTAYMPSGSVPDHIYLNGAEVLRPEFSAEKAHKK